MLDWIETKLMYPAPDRLDGDWNPMWLRFEDVAIPSRSGNAIHAWFLPHANPRCSILFCHGNGEHLAYLSEELDFLRRRLRANVLSFDYPGYGNSRGKPCEPGILRDAECVLNWLSERIRCPSASVVLWGRSLGGAVAVHLAARFGARCLVLDRTFDSMVEVAAAHFPWLPVRLLLRNRYASAETIARYQGPVFQVHGKTDQIVPLERGAALFEACPTRNKEWICSSSLGHNDPWPESYYQAVEDFLDNRT